MRQIATQHVDTPLGGTFLPDDQPQEGRLSRPRGPNEEHELVAIDLDVDVV